MRVQRTELIAVADAAAHAQLGRGRGGLHGEAARRSSRWRHPFVDVVGAIEAAIVDVVLAIALDSSEPDVQ